MRPLRVLAASLAVLFIGSAPLSAHVTRVEIVSQKDVLNGQPFGSGGPYERLTGRVYFSVAIDNPHNRGIVDLANAVNLKNGEVEFSSDFIVIRAKDPAKRNGSLLLEAPNRGRSRIVSIVDGGSWDLSSDVGDAWLLRNGFTIASLGWQWDATNQDALRLYAPIAKENGKAITGLLRGDVMLAKTMDEIPLGHLIIGEIGGPSILLSHPTIRETFSPCVTRAIPSAASSPVLTGSSPIRKTAN